MPGKRLIVQEEAGIGVARVGHTMATAGKVLLWMDFLLLAFVYVGVRSGSMFWTWWVIGEAILGVALLAAGIRIRKRAVARSHGPGWSGNLPPMHG